MSGSGRFFIVKKKIKKAHHRNRVRRLLKESYRISKHSLIDIAEETKINLRILFTLSPEAYNSYDELEYKTLCSDMTELLKLTEIYLQK